MGALAPQKASSDGGRKHLTQRQSLQFEQISSPFARKNHRAANVPICTVWHCMYFGVRKRSTSTRTERSIQVHISSACFKCLRTKDIQVGLWAFCTVLFSIFSQLSLSTKIAKTDFAGDARFPDDRVLDLINRSCWTIFVLEV